MTLRAGPFQQDRPISLVASPHIRGAPDVWCCVGVSPHEQRRRLQGIL
jgi:hypothetical protein